ncbi:MAG: hypothetical protein DBX05_02595 [Candidatus Poseidoniales archaeon]|nr:MAG: hypothetical protein DBX05_02595 [Candidatus Poseidoniales archaeon]
MDDWRERISALPDEQRTMFEGGTLSQFFLRWPLTASHPTFVGSFYGLLISLSLLGPILFIQSEAGSSAYDSLRSWAFLCLSLLMLCGIFGGVSALTVAITKRIPIRLEQRRKYLFPIPFIGLLLFSIARIEPNLIGISDQLGWVLLIAPGPLYIHLSYAPRWRLLERLSRGLELNEQPMKVGKERDLDSDLIEAVDEIHGEE